VRWFTRCLTPGVWAVLASLLVVMPAAAAGPTETTPTPTPHLMTTLSPATLNALQTQASRSQDPADTGGAFFKTKKGAVVLVLIAAGFGYTFYSKSHDRVASPIR
jgi:hypothetical protein